MIAALAFVVLPGAVAQPASEEQPPLETESDSAINARESAAASAPQVQVSTKVYDVGELLTRLAADESISTEEARESLVGIFERAVSPVMEMPQGFPALPKVAESHSVLAPPPPRQLSSISIDGDQLTVVQSDIGHAKLKEEMDRFRKFGFKRFQVTVRSIIGSAEEINALMSSLKMEEPFSDITKAPVADAKSEQSAVKTIQMGTTGIVTRYLVRAIEELARSKTNCLSVESLQIQSFNGQTRMTHVGEMKPYIIGFDEKDEPTIRMVIDGMTLRVTPTVLDAGLIRLQCVSRIETVSKTHTVAMSRSSGKLPKRIQVPVIESKQVQTLVELQDDQTLWLSGLTSSSDGKSQAILFTLEVTLISSPYEIVDQPLRDGIGVVGDPVSSQVVANHGESISTVKPKDQPIVETPESTSLRVPALPLPRWISKPSSGLLVKLIWDARAAAQRRLLMTDQRTPWQFMNGLAALRRDFLVRDGDEAVTALDWLRNCKSFPGQPWFEKTEFGGKPNPTPAPLWFDGHAEQFVASLAMNDVPLDAKFATADGTITMGDMIRHLQMTVNPKSIPPWTLIALTKYLPPDAEWVKPDGEPWDVEKVVKHVVDCPSGTMSTTSLAALVFARDQYLRTGRPVQGVWLEAQDRIADAIHRTEARAIAAGEIRPLYRPRLFPHWKSYQRPGSPPFSESPEDRELMDGNLRHTRKMFESDFLRTQRETLQFLTSTLTDDQLREDWFRLQIEAAANELIGNWSNKEIQSSFYETTQALTTYLERYSVYLQQLDAAGRSPVLADGVPVGIVIKGAVRQPTSYHSRAGVRLLDVISLAGGPQDEAAEKVTVVRNAEKKTQPSVIRINLERAKRGVDPNIFVMPDDEILVHPAEIVKLPLEATIRLDDAFVLSPNLAIQGETVILFLNDKPITVEQFMGRGWGTLEAATELSDIDRKQVVSEAIISGLPEFVFQELILQHFDAGLPELNKNLSPEQRETANRNFGEALQQLPRTADSRVQAQYLAVILAKESAANTASRRQQVDGFLRGWQPNTVASNKSAVVKHVQELVTTARLRRVVSLDYTNTTLVEVLRSVEQVHGLRIKVNSLHDQISQRIFDRPPVVDFHSENKSLGDSLTAIFHPYGLELHQEGDEVVLQFADSKQAMDKFHSLPGPPSFGVFGVLRNPGWHPLDQEILLLDALAIAGGVENADGVSIEITNPDILSGKSIPVSMSLLALQRDTSGRLNRVIKDGDMITVTRTGSTVDGTAKISRAGSSGDDVVTGVDRRAVITLTGVGFIVESDGSNKDAEKSNGNLVSVNGKFPGAVRDMPERKVASPEAPFVLCVYPVADLVVNRKAVIATASQSSVAVDSAQQPVNAPESSEKSGDELGANSESALPETKSISLNVKADFAPLTELIKATVQPESWTSEGRGLIAVEEKSQTLVIKQTQTAHDEIAT
ncbi:MAG: SLBB domain-containing protein, partial [Planctomycetaceae bacterium]|nr:SLBB domain-containing protein [Planctomycetaceae bacterium]